MKEIEKFEIEKFRWAKLKQKSPSGGGGHEGLSVVCHSGSVHWVQRRLLAVAQYVLEGRWLGAELGFW
jgi:hypothetical protein